MGAILAHIDWRVQFERSSFHDELARMETARTVRRVRAGTGLSQTAFARAFHINVGRLRDLEQGRTTADSALLAYLRIIDRDPDLVRRALG